MPTGSGSVTRPVAEEQRSTDCGEKPGIFVTGSISGRPARPHAAGQPASYNRENIHWNSRIYDTDHCAFFRLVCWHGGCFVTHPCGYRMRVARVVVTATAAASVSITLRRADVPVVTAPGDQGPQLAVVSDNASGAIVVWQDRGLSVIFAQGVDSSSKRLWGAAKQVAITEWEKFDPAAVEDGSGGAIVAWAEGRSGWCTAGFMGDCDIYAQRFSSSGARLWGESGVPITLARANQAVSGISIASDGNGGAFLAWEDARPDCCKVYAQHVSADGSPSWASDGIRLSPEPTIVFGPIASPPQVVPDGRGGAIVAWLENQVDPMVEPPPVTVQRIDAEGNVQWMENGVRVGTPVCATFTLASDGAGGAFIAFVADTDADFGER